MTYITTHHQFVIDDKHPTDVFDEMSNFFSLYTVTLDAFHQLSIGLTVPENFDINSNAKLNTAYQNFIKAVRYSIPDAHVLPIHTAAHTATSDGQIEAGMLELMIQYHEGRMLPSATTVGENKPKFYQKILGVMLPQFDSTQEQEGMYPQRQPQNPLQRLEPVVPTISQPAPTPAVAPIAPQPILASVVSQPIVQPQYQNPSSVQPQAVPSIQPVATPISQSISPPRPPVTPQPLPIHYLPKPNVSIKPYRELLTQTIIDQAKQDKSTNAANQPISEVILKTKDSLTTAMVETLFASFAKPNEGQAGQRAYDAIDLASYGLEELRPKLRQIGVMISDEAQFSLNAKAKATAQDLEKIRQGLANPTDIHLAAQLNYGSAIISANSIQSQQDANQAVTSTSQALSLVTSNHPINANVLNIAINIQVSDSMGERTVKLREFPAVFSTQNTYAQSAKLIKVMSKQVTGEAFYLSEQDGQLLAQNVAQNITLHRNGQTSNLKENAILLPNDILQIGQDVQISLLLN